MGDEEKDGIKICHPCMGGELSSPFIGDKLSDRRAEYWARAAEWNFYDAFLLAFGIDPHRVNMEEGTIQIAIGDLVREFEHYYGRSSWKEYRSPGEWVRLITEVGRIFPQNLLIAISEKPKKTQEVLEKNSQADLR